MALLSQAQPAVEQDDKVDDWETYWVHGNGTSIPLSEPLDNDALDSISEKVEDSQIEIIYWSSVPLRKTGTIIAPWQV